MSESGGCLQCCCSFIFTLGLSALFLWLSLRTSNPSFSIEDLSVRPAAGAATNVTFLVKLNNPNKDKGVYYDDVNLALYLVNASHPVANYTVPRFYQGHKKSAKKTGSFQTTRVNWTDLTAANTTSFRVDLETAVRFKIMAWDTKRHRQKVTGNVAVNATGDKPKSKKGVKLTSAASSPQVGFFLTLLLLYFGFLLLYSYI